MYHSLVASFSRKYGFLMEAVSLKFQRGKDCRLVFNISRFVFLSNMAFLSSRLLGEKSRITALNGGRVLLSLAK